MNLIIIASIGKNNELGKNNDLVWKLKKDLQFFKEKTEYNMIVMGENTYKSLPNLLSNRHHVVISPDLVDNKVEVFRDIPSFLENYKNYEKDIYVIGGGSIYKQFLPHVFTMYLTEINETESLADTFFPEFDRNDWNKEIIKADVEEKIEFTINKYERK